MEQRRRSISTYSRHISAPPEKVFPQLCPVREYDWIEGWQGKLVYSDSGVAELDCVFTTTSSDAIGPETWTCSRYEPLQRIDYVRMSAHTVIRLQLDLAAAGTGTRLTAALVITALDRTGDDLVAGCNSGTCEAQFKPCFLMLDHFLRTGAMLPGKEALALAAGDH